MPSSMIFVGLVVLWLIVLVPTVARYRQEVDRPSAAALSGRVLARPRRRRNPKVGGVTVESRGGDADAHEVAVPAPRTAEMELPRHAVDPVAHDAAGSFARAGDGRAVDDRSADDRAEDDPAGDDRAGDDRADDDRIEDVGRGSAAVRDERGSDRRPPRYRPGRGGYDAEAADASARARYAVRQRLVVTLLVAAVATGVVAAAYARTLWWVHIGVDVVLLGYLAYLRRQVRLEDAIRAQRAARLANRRRPPADVHHEDRLRGRSDLDHRELDGAGRADVDPDDRRLDDRSTDSTSVDGTSVDSTFVDVDPADTGDPIGTPLDGDEPEPERVTGTGEPVGLLRGLPERQETALPRLQPAPLPSLPAGTALVEADDAALALPEIELPHRRAVGE